MVCEKIPSLLWFQDGYKIVLGMSNDMIVSTVRWKNCYITLNNPYSVKFANI